MKTSKTPSMAIQATTPSNNFLGQIIKHISWPVLTKANTSTKDPSWTEASVTKRVKWNIGVGLHDINW
jgi:hypothetical protein